MSIRSLAVAAIACAIAALGHAQTVVPQTGQVRTQVPAGISSQTASTAQLDHAIAACLVLGNKEEIELAQFAKEHAESDEVKKFADQMIKEHKQAIEKLQQAIPAVASINLEGSGQEGQYSSSQHQQSGQNSQLNPTTQGNQFNNQSSSQAAMAGGGSSHQMIELQRRVAAECLKLTKQKLGEKNGAEFDRCYIGQQMGAHVGMLAKLRGSQQSATGQLKQVLQESEQVVQKHLEHAEEIAKSLEKEWRQEGSEQASRTSQSRG